MQIRSHLEPKNSIYAPHSQHSNSNSTSTQQAPYLWLQQTALKQHQCLPLKLPQQLPQIHTQILIPILLPLHLLRQTLLKPFQNLRIAKLALRKPSLRDDAEALSQHAKVLRTVGHHHNGFLHRTARDICWAIYELGGVHLARTGDAEEGGCGEGLGSGAEEGEIGEVFGRAVNC